MRKKSTFYVIQACILILAASCGSSDTTNDNGTQKNDEKAEPGITSEDVTDIGFLFESPGEALQALENISGEINWNELATYNRSTEFANEQLIALNLGVAVTDAIIAIKSANVSQMMTMNQVVSDLSEKLGVAQTVGANRDSLAILVAQNKWDDLTLKIEKIQASALGEMQSGDKKDLVNLIVLGGWFEGLKVITSHFVVNYEADDSKLLHQGAFVEYMLNNLSEDLDAGLKDNLNSTLTGINDITGSKEQGGEFTQEEVKTINTLVKNFINSIQ